MSEHATQAQTASTGAHVAPGWYPDPAASGGERWWDGFTWSEEHTRATRPATPPPVAPIQASHPRGGSKKTPIVAAICVLWGAGILVNHFFLTHPTGNADYDSGASAAAIFGGLMVVAGLFVLARWRAQRPR